MSLGSHALGRLYSNNQTVLELRGRAARCPPTSPSSPSSRPRFAPGSPPLPATQLPADRPPTPPPAYTPSRSVPHPHSPSPRSSAPQARSQLSFPRARRRAGSSARACP
ncbi:hypothetical protein BDN71DRAFT_665397 [Pleurotus eryngii]|uniref:Uncharacterized protein n=1 Tax=Pleurotus eryngii TaxID=5323 RepID=A0A9P6D8Z3_PLEER|nr:hypothetical protein BDN71DRAFT_665397 [Pleurotus eryngii]